MRGVLVVLLIALAGCSGSPSAVEGRFLGADHHWNGVAEAAFEESTTVDLPAGQHTLRLAVEAEHGFGIFLEGPGGERNGFTHVREVDAPSIQYLMREADAGTWRLLYGCDGPCRYSIAIDEGPHLPDLDLPEVTADATFQGHLERGGADRQLPVVGDLGNATLVVNIRSQGPASWAIHDADGARVTNWNFPGLHAMDWRYQPVRDDLVAGTWTFAVQCDGPCDYFLGVDDL